MTSNMAATFSTTVTIPEPKIGGGGPHGPGTRPPGGGGDGGSGESLPDYGARLRRYRLGLGAGLISVTMIFVSLTSAYIVRQGLGSWDDAANAYVLDWKPVNIPTVLLLINTAILLASSFTMEMARRRLARQAALAPVLEIPGIASGPELGVPWLGITLVLGISFLLGQWMAWQELARRGFYLSGNPSSSFFYVLTGTHALHLAGGILALFYAALISVLGRRIEQRRIVVDVTAWYWHFMGALWIYIFALLQFAR